MDRDTKSKDAAEPPEDLHRGALRDNALLREKLREAEETLDAIRYGTVDAVLVKQSGSSKIFTLVNADRPYRFLIEQMKEGAVTLSGDGVILYGNRRLGELLETPLEKVVGSNIKRFFASDGSARFDKLLATTGTEPSRAEFSIARRSGPPVPIYISLNDIVSDEGAPRLVGAVITDLTDQRAMEARLSQAQKMEAVGQLTGGLAHNFNNLLQAVCGNLHLISMRPEYAAGVRQWAENGLKAADRGTRLTAQLLAFSRSQDVDLQPINVTDLIGGMADLLFSTVGVDIDVQYALEESEISVLADKTQLEMALLNLAINASDAMPDGGRLQIITTLRDISNDPELADGQYLDISVSDTGTGMTESVRGRAFEPFYTTKAVGAGTGLGLAQVYGIARQAGGAARIASIEGAGTTVTLLLRASAIDTSVGPDDSGCDSVVVQAKVPAEILVIDDDDDVRSLYVECLSLLGYEVSQAADGLAGLEMMAENLPDVLVTDFAMPHLNGAEMVKIARSRGYEMPVIFASGYSNTEELNEAVGSKANVLLKPFSVQTLVRAVEKALADVPKPDAISDSGGVDQAFPDRINSRS
jgi:PAS domain S-box-containing protein